MRTKAVFRFLSAKKCLSTDLFVGARQGKLAQIWNKLAVSILFDVTNAIWVIEGDSCFFA
jgi:hypothetical protein